MNANPALFIAFTMQPPLRGGLSYARRHPRSVRGHASFRDTYFEVHQAYTNTAFDAFPYFVAVSTTEIQFVMLPTLSELVV